MTGSTTRRRTVPKTRVVTRDRHAVGVAVLSRGLAGVDLGRASRCSAPSGRRAAKRARGSGRGAGASSSAYIARVVAALPGGRRSARRAPARPARGARRATRPTTNARPQTASTAHEAVRARAPARAAAPTGRARRSRRSVGPPDRRALPRAQLVRRVACAAPVTALDWIIVALHASLMAPSRATSRASSSAPLSLAGFAAGAFLGTRLGPLLLAGGSHSPYAPLFGLVGALLGGLLLALGFEGLGYGLRAAGAGSPGARDRRRRCSARCSARRVALGLAWLAGAVGAADAGRARRCATTPALGDPARAQRRAAAVGADPQRAGALRPVPAHRRPGGRRRRRRARRSRATRRCAPRRASVVQGPRHRLRARRRGLGLGGARRRSCHQRARRRRPGRHDGAAARRAGRSSTRTPSPSTPATTSRCCASPASARRRCRCALDPRAGTRGGDPRLPARTARTTSAPARLGHDARR